MHGVSQFSNGHLECHSNYRPSFIGIGQNEFHVNGPNSGLQPN